MSNLRIRGGAIGILNCTCNTASRGEIIAKVEFINTVYLFVSGYTVLCTVPTLIQGLQSHDKV